MTSRQMMLKASFFILALSVILCTHTNAQEVEFTEEVGSIGTLADQYSDITMVWEASGYSIDYSEGDTSFAMFPTWGIAPTFPTSDMADGKMLRCSGLNSGVEITSSLTNIMDLSKGFRVGFFANMAGGWISGRNFLEINNGVIEIKGDSAGASNGLFVTWNSSYKYGYQNSTGNKFPDEIAFIEYEFSPEGNVFIYKNGEWAGSNWFSQTSFSFWKVAFKTDGSGGTFYMDNLIVSSNNKRSLYPLRNLEWFPAFKEAKQ